MNVQAPNMLLTEMRPGSTGGFGNRRGIARGRIRQRRKGIARALGAGLALVLALAAPAAALEQKLIATDGAAGDQFGGSVAVDGDTAVVGAVGAEAGRGAVYVFKRVGDGWSQTAKLTASDGAPGDWLGISVAIEGDTIVAGAYRHDVGADADQGSAYTFARTGPAARIETAKLTASDGAAGDRLGSSVAIEGDTIVAGAYRDDVGPNAGQGSAYTFARTGPAARSETAKLTASDGAASDWLGLAVAIEGDTIVAGAYLDDIAADADQGSAYTFARTGPAARSETAKLTATDGAPDDGLGNSVAIEGDAIVVGAYLDDVGADADQGSAYTFARTGPAARSETAKLTATDGAADDGLGSSVAIEGDAIVAGAHLANVGANSDQGSAYTFARSGPIARNQTAQLTATDGAPNDELGASIALANDTIVAGGYLDDVGANADQGSAWVFFSRSPPGPGPVVLKPGACANPQIGTGAADALRGTQAGDRLYGLGGRDRLSGLGGRDCLYGGAGSDRLIGGIGSDRLAGSSDKDRLAGGSGSDRLVGGSGNDHLTGGSGNDRLSGGSGSDRLNGGRGRNRYAAGTGRDIVNARNRRRDRVDCGPGRDIARVDRFDRVRRCERVRRG